MPVIVSFCASEFVLHKRLTLLALRLPFHMSFHWLAAHLLSPAAVSIPKSVAAVPKQMGTPSVSRCLTIKFPRDLSFCRAFNPCIFSRHSYLCYRLPQQLFDFRFRCFTVKSCCYSFALIRVVMGSVGFVVSVFTFFFHHGDFLFYVRDSSIDLFVLVFAFFYFRDGCVHSTKLGSD